LGESQSETVKCIVYCTLYIVKDRHVLSSERAPHIKNPQWSDSNKNLVVSLDTRQTGRLTVGRNMTLTLIESVVLESSNSSFVRELSVRLWSVNQRTTETEEVTDSWITTKSEIKEEKTLVVQ
jgi:hypothetical protein